MKDASDDAIDQIQSTHFKSYRSFAYYSDFWNENIQVTYDQNILSDTGKLIKLKEAYLELCKLMYLPFIYGYDFSCVSLSGMERRKIFFDLLKVRYKYFDTPSDVATIVEAVIALSDEIVDHGITDSPYLQRKVDEYVSLYDAVSDDEVKSKEDALTALKSFEQKKTIVTRDNDLNQYLSVFMDTVTSSYRIAELIDSGQFELKQRGNSVIVSSAIDLLSLVPMAGPGLRTMANLINDEVKKRVQEQVNESAKITINSFYHSEIEQSTELVCVNMLTMNTELIKNRIEMIKPEHRSQDNSDILSNWVENKLQEVKDFIRSDFASYRPHDFLRDKYKEPAQQIAYRDAWCMTEIIGEGYFRVDPESQSNTNILDEKIEKMQTRLDEIINETDEQWADERSQRGYICGSSCRLF